MPLPAGRNLAAVFAPALPLGLAVAESPPQKPTKGKSHPNLAAAQKLAAQAFDKLEAAQKANEYDLGGHAAKAKAFLKQANDEIGLAWQAAEKTKEDKR